MDLNDNKLSGKLDASFWNLASLRFLSVARNNFSGEINQGIGLSNISQRIVFKFNESSKQLDYIGYGFYKFCNITGIYQGKL